MANQILGKCPVCGGNLVVSKLHCYQCETSIEGNFEPSKFARLNKEQQYFLEIFVKARGNIKEVERELGISYPTVRSRLDAIILALGYKVEPDYEDEKYQEKRKSILAKLDKGEIDAAEALRQLKNLG